MVKMVIKAVSVIIEGITVIILAFPLRHTTNVHSTHGNIFNRLAVNCD